MKLTEHFARRAQQRALKKDVLQFILDWGTEIRAAGAIFLVVIEDSLPAYITEDMKEAVRDRAVVVSEEGSHLLTAYKRENVHRYLKKKPKHSIPREARIRAFDRMGNRKIG